MTYQQNLDWLITMAREPAWKAYAWHKAQQMDKCPSGLWTGIAAELTAEMKREKESE
jgi:hypothetical protein